MPWSYANIDWNGTADAGLVATLLASFVVGSGAIASSRFRAGLVAFARRRTVRIFAGIYVIEMAFAVLVIVAAQDPGGWTGQVMAAWVQAIGSVAAVAGAAMVGVYQAGQARELVKEQERHRAAELLRERVSMLESASAIARWAADRLTELVGFLPDPAQAAEAERNLPHVAQQFVGLQARAAAIAFAQIPRSGREMVFALEHYLSAISGMATVAIGDLAAGRADPESICRKLASDFLAAQRSINGLASDLANLAREAGVGSAAN